ncbi:vWA domain-containing protein [Nocardioides sambongensis]|uniref:vWA domain-containing protein n=1 Tax=Nocardioides sambongensis TaxID=2589074 RepID=UPI0011272350|nr:VWA domain-containing protein [Nocardioides sambongensis]
MSPRLRLGLVIARRVAILIALMVILVRPTAGEADVPTQVADVEVVVVLDRTRSMAALDYDGDQPRIDGARADLEQLARSLPGARFGLLTYGLDVQFELPFTTDVNAFTSAMETMQLESPTGGVGSSLDRPRQQLVDILTDAQEQRPDRRRMIVFVSDGERTMDGNTASYDEVGELVAGGLVLGYGTTEGAPMPAGDDLDEPGELVQDPSTGEDAISKADPDALRELAGQLGVDYVARTEPGGMAALADEFEATYVPGGDDDQERAQNEVTWIAGLALLPLVLLELRSGWRALWTSRSALAGRRGKGGRG